MHQNKYLKAKGIIWRVRNDQVDKYMEKIDKVLERKEISEADTQSLYYNAVSLIYNYVQQNKIKPYTFSKLMLHYYKKYWRIGRQHPVHQKESIC